MLAQREVRNPARNAESRFREFVDGKRHWIVHEQADQPAHPAGNYLLFESADVLRLVRRYPSNWFELSPAELSHVSESL